MRSEMLSIMRMTSMTRSEIAYGNRQGGRIRRFLWRLCVRAIFRLSRRIAFKLPAAIVAVNVGKKPIQKGAMVNLAGRKSNAWRWN